MWFVKFVAVVAVYYVCIMSSKRRAKLQKLESLRTSIPHMTANAMSTLLKRIADDGLPDVRSRGAMREAVESLSDAVTPFGPVVAPLPLTMIDGTTSESLAIHPIAFLYHAFTMSEPFRDLLLYIHSQENISPEKPLRLIIYSDEVVPGKELAHRNERKQWCCYWSFAQLLPWFHLEEVWFPILSIRTSLVNETAAGISQVVASALKLFFTESTSDLSVGGALLTSGDTSLRIWADLWMVLQDGGAHKLLWHCKGDSGTKICMLCLNDITAEDSGSLDDDGLPILVCKDLAETVNRLATDADIFGTVDRLAAAKAGMSANLFRMREQACGFNDEPFGILRNPELRRIVLPASQYCHDWMHAIMASEIIGIVIHLLLKAIAVASGEREVYSNLESYCKSWKWPVAKR